MNKQIQKDNPVTYWNENNANRYVIGDGSTPIIVPWFNPLVGMNTVNWVLNPPFIPTGFPTW